MGYKLNSSVIHDVPARSVERPDGWPPALKWALAVAADSANAETGILLDSARTLAKRTGGHERTVRKALDRAELEGMCRRPRRDSSRVIFTHPERINAGQRPASADTNAGHTPASSNGSVTNAGQRPASADTNAGHTPPDAGLWPPNAGQRPAIKGSHGYSQSKGTRASARRPQDIGLTDEQIAAKNRADLAWKLRQEDAVASKVGAKSQPTAEERAEYERRAAIRLAGPAP